MKRLYFIGDLVEITGIQDSLDAIGRFATVVKVGQSSECVTVQFDDRFSIRLHEGGTVRDTSRRCWVYEIEKLRPAMPIDLNIAELL